MHARSAAASLCTALLVVACISSAALSEGDAEELRRLRTASCKHHAAERNKVILIYLFIYSNAASGRGHPQRERVRRIEGGRSPAREALDGAGNEKLGGGASTQARYLQPAFEDPPTSCETAVTDPPRCSGVGNGVNVVPTVIPTQPPWYAALLGFDLVLTPTLLGLLGAVAVMRAKYGGRQSKALLRRRALLQLMETRRAERAAAAAAEADTDEGSSGGGGDGQAEQRGRGVSPAAAAGEPCSAEPGEAAASRAQQRRRRRRGRHAD